MPKYYYEYKCLRCSIERVEERTIEDRDKVPTCPKCYSPMIRMLPKPANTGDKGKGRWGSM